MSAITDLIAKQVQAAASGSKLENNVLSSLSDSILGGIKQTASTASGVQQLTNLFSGNASATSVNALASAAGKIFTSTAASKLGLSASATSSATALLPTIINGIAQAVASKGSNLDISSILTSLGVSSAKASTLSKLGSALGSLFRKK